MAKIYSIMQFSEHSNDIFFKVFKLTLTFYKVKNSCFGRFFKWLRCVIQFFVWKLNYINEYFILECKHLFWEVLSNTYKL